MPQSKLSSFAALGVAVVVVTVSAENFVSLVSSTAVSTQQGVLISGGTPLRGQRPSQRAAHQLQGGLAPAARLAALSGQIGVVGLAGLLSSGLLIIAAVVRGFRRQAPLLQPLCLPEHFSMASTTATIAPEKNLGAGKTIRIATRKSPLAMWQAEFIQSELERLWPGVKIELQPMSTKGDKILDSPLAKVGGKGLFVKELETALLERRSDIAVHSTKDVPMELPEGLVLGIICKRHDPCDAIVFPKGSTLKSIDDLPQGARVGTSSLRRQCQLLLKRPDLKFLELRGNVNTRLAKLDSGDYDAIILAAAGLKRLGFADRILPGETNIVDPNLMLPAAGQGALSIELRTDDPVTMELVRPLHHIPDAVTVVCERAMNRRLSGGCQVPISGFAVLRDGQLRMEARVGSVTGQGPLIINHKTIPFTLDKPWPTLQKEAEGLGVEVADMLLRDGAQAYLDEAYAKEDVGVGLKASLRS